MTILFVLCEHCSERFIGVFSTLDKAKAAAQAYMEQVSRKDYDVKESDGEILYDNGEMAVKIVTVKPI